MYIGGCVAHTCANVHMRLNVYICVGVARVCMCECVEYSSVYVLVRVCAPQACLTRMKAESWGFRRKTAQML